MRRKRFVLLFLIVGNISNGQIAFELFSSTQYISQEIWWEKSFSDSSRWSIFNYTRFQIDYDSSNRIDYFSYNTVNYYLKNNLGVALGGFLTQEGFVPILAANYFIQREIWNFSIFPSIELKANPFYEIFFFTQVRPKLNDKWSLFMQVIGNSNFNFNKHRFSELLFRFGLQRKTFQFGIGTDARLFGMEENNSTKQVFSNNFGIFIRKEL